MKPKVLLYFLNVGKNALEVNGDWSRKSLTFCKLHFFHFSFTFYIRTYVIMHLIPEVFARHRTFQSSRHAFPRDCFIVRSDTPDCRVTGLHLIYEDYMKAGVPVTVCCVTQRLVYQSCHRPDMPTRQFPYPTDTLQRNTKLRKQKQRWVKMIQEMRWVQDVKQFIKPRLKMMSNILM